MPTTPFPPEWLRTWSWKGLEVSYLYSPAPQHSGRSTVVLIHGFGACKEHWRHNVPALANSHAVLAIDLIGFGSSGKPRSRLCSDGDQAEGWAYGIDSWAEQVVALIEHLGLGPVQLVGNSIGGVVALRAAERLEQSGRPARQVVLIDCAQRTLDDKRLAEQPPLRQVGRPLLKALVRQRWFTRLLFGAIAKPGLIRRVLMAAYPSGQNVNADLVEILYQPTQRAGADEAFRGFINLFDDLLAPDMLARLRTPVALLWGELDPWEPVAEANRWQRFDCVTSLAVLQGRGHCPHDEDPESVNSHLHALVNTADQQPC